MITTKQQLWEYIYADRKAQGMQHPLLAKLFLEVPMIVDVINIIIFLGYSLTMFYALFAVKDLLSNLFSLGQTANNIY